MSAAKSSVSSELNMPSRFLPESIRMRILKEVNDLKNGVEFGGGPLASVGGEQDGSKDGGKPDA